MSVTEHAVERYAERIGGHQGYLSSLHRLEIRKLLRRIANELPFPIEGKCYFGKYDMTLVFRDKCIVTVYGHREEVA